MDRFLVEEPGKQQPQQVAGEGGDGAFGRQVFAVQMVDAPDARIRRDEFIRQLGDRFHGQQYPAKIAQTQAWCKAFEGA